MNKKKILKIILNVVTIALFVGLIIYLLPVMKGLLTNEGRIEYKNKLDGMGAGKFWILFTLEIAQILLVVLPGEPLEILAGMCYGTIGGTIFIMGTVCITTTIVLTLTIKWARKKEIRVREADPKAACHFCASVSPSESAAHWGSPH